MNIEKTTLDGVFLISFPCQIDIRGDFRKFSHAGEFAESGLRHDFKECFCSKSIRHALRGMHIQQYPHSAAKLVSVVCGRVLDVVLNIGTHEFTYNELVAGQSVYVPEGFAHGFLSLEDDTVMMYQQTAVYHPESDKGIRYDSFGFNWGVQKFAMSVRDFQFPTLEQYENTVDRWVG